MNSKPGKIWLVGAVGIALMFLFPPFYYFDGDTSGKRSAGYHFFLKPPAPRPVAEVFWQARFPHMATVRRDNIRLDVQVLLAILTGAGLAILFKKEYSVMSLTLGILLVSPVIMAVAFVAWMVISLSMRPVGALP